MDQSVKAPVFLSIVFSFRNEERVIPELVRRVRAVMDEALQKEADHGASNDLCQ